VGLDYSTGESSTKSGLFSKKQNHYTIRIRKEPLRLGLPEIREPIDAPGVRSLGAHYLAFMAMKHPELESSVLEILKPGLDPNIESSNKVRISIISGFTNFRTEESLSFVRKLKEDLEKNDPKSRESFWAGNSLKILERNHARYMNTPEASVAVSALSSEKEKSAKTSDLGLEFEPLRFDLNLNQSDPLENKDPFNLSAPLKQR